MLFNHIKRTEMIKNVQLYENIRDSSAAYMVSGRRPAPHENRRSALKKARRCRANVCHPASLRLTFLQMKNIIISKRAANLRKSSFAARFIFKLDMIVKSV